MTARKPKIRHPGAVVANKEYPHGTHARYVLNRCRCDDCREANNQYEATRKLWQGEFPRIPPPLVDSAPVRRHVKALMKRGMGHKRIAQLAGVPSSAVGAIIWGRYDRAAKRVRRETAEKLLAVKYTAEGSMRVPAKEGRLIVEELLARGWTKAAIGRRVHGHHAKSLQAVEWERMEANTLRILRRLMTEDVPKRRHPRGTLYTPKGRPPRPVPQITEGMYDRAPAGKLRCEICDRPLAFHLMTERCA